jgi:hypothetical protein
MTHTNFTYELFEIIELRLFKGCFAWMEYPLYIFNFKFSRQNSSPNCHSKSRHVGNTIELEGGLDPSKTIFD